MSAIAIIPAKGHSSRIPRKNIRLFMGHPMLGHAIVTAEASGLFDSIVVSTEDAEVAAVAREYGALVNDRPRHLSEFDGAPDPGTQEIARHTLREMGVHKDAHVCCLYPCTPLLDELDLALGYTDLMLAKHTYVFQPGQFYWGHAWAFLSRIPLGARGLELDMMGERAIDINTLDDVAKAERVFASILAGPK